LRRLASRASPAGKAGTSGYHHKKQGERRAMEYRQLGSSGLSVSLLSLGSWVTWGEQVGEEIARECLVAAVEAGVNFIDTAEVYADGRAEEVLGNVLQKEGWKRSDLVISTKIFWGGKGPNDRGLSRKHITEGLDASLDRLKLDYVDLLFCHRPDPKTPIEETVWTMTDMIRSGLVFYWGTSEWSAPQIMEAWAIARREHLIPPTMEQPQYNMFCRERVEKEYAPLYAQIGLGTTIWSPLASGVLTGKYEDGIPAGTRATLPGYEWLRKKFDEPATRDQVARVKKLRAVAKDLECTLSQLAIAWCAHNPVVSTVILGASNAEQLRENLGAAEVVPRLTDAVLERIEAVLENRPKPVTLFR
jgi:voltage-dependent potassium channel beta subunit